MIEITNLIKNKPPIGNFFAPDAYVQGDFESGLIESRGGSRLIVLPEILLESIYTALDKDLGQATNIVIFNCGRWWGKYFYRRFGDEVSEYYGKPIAQMEMIEFLQCLKACWKTYGWGLLDLQIDYYDQGFLIVTTQNSPWAHAAPKSDQPKCWAEAGILSAFFSQLTGRELHCVQTACESLSSNSNYFILGLAERLEIVTTWVEQGLDHQQVLKRLNNQSFNN